MGRWAFRPRRRHFHRAPARKTQSGAFEADPDCQTPVFAATLPERRFQGDKLGRSALALGLVAGLSIGGCDAQPLETNQVAQQSMIGLARRDILACLGRPTERVDAGQATEIWTYPGAQMRGYGPQWALLLNSNLVPFAPGGSCSVKLVMTNAKVSQIGYAAPGGGPLPLGQECLFAVERCVKAP